MALRNDHALLAQQKSELEARLRQASESLTAAEAAGQGRRHPNQDLSRVSAEADPTGQPAPPRH